MVRGLQTPDVPPRAAAEGDGSFDHLTTLAPGARVGKYEMRAVLGQGAFGITYRARDMQLDREVAIKEYLPAHFAARRPDNLVLPRSTRHAEDFRWGRERFLDEAKTLARLEGAVGIVNVHDYLEAYGTAYMVMSLVRGETLEDNLKRERRLTQQSLEQILYPLLDGLELVHAAGFLHRDIKPSNILIDALGRPTLIDFGAARLALHGHTQAMTAVYTPGYAAFEQVTAGKQGPWTDVFSLAATLYHAIVGTAPPSVLERLAEDKLVPAVEVGKGRFSRELLRGIDIGLRLKAADRPQSIAEWRRILSGATPSRVATVDSSATRRIDPDPRLLAQYRQPGHRRRYLWIAAGVIVLCLGGAGAYVWLGQPKETVEQALRRAEEESRRQAELAARLRQQEEARRAAEQERLRREEEVRKAAAEKAAAEKAEAEKRAAEAERLRSEAETRRKAEEEAQARMAAQDKAAAEAAARRKAEEEAKARAEAEARRKAEEEAQARKTAQEKVAADAEARRKAEEEAKARAEAEARRKAEEEAQARKTAQEKVVADAEARRKAQEETKARADADARRKAEEEALARKAAQEKVAAETEARRKAQEEAKARAEAEARRKAEEEAQARKAAQEKVAAEAEVRRKAQEEAKARAETEARRKAEEDAQARKAAQEKVAAEAETKRQAEASEVSLRLSEPDRQRVQVALTALGYDTRGNDGVMGPRTRAMIAEWQKSRGYPETGYLTEPQLAALREQAAVALAKFDEEQKRREAAPRPAPPPAYDGAAAARCRAITARAEVGEPLSPAELALLRSGCKG